MGVTNSLNFYVGTSTDVGDMLLHGQTVRKTRKTGKQNIRVSYVNETWIRVWGRGFVQGNE